jgi:hypothetical protein
MAIEQNKFYRLVPQLKYKFTKQMKNGPKTWIQDWGKSEMIFSRFITFFTLIFYEAIRDGENFSILSHQN